MSNNQNREFILFLQHEGKAKHTKNHMQEIMLENSNDINKSVENIFALGQASIIASILAIDPNELDLAQLQYTLRRNLSQDEKLKGYVYDVMKDI